MNLTPREDIVVLERLPDEEKTFGGIYIPRQLLNYSKAQIENDGRNELIRAKVVAVGPGRKRKNGSLIPMQVKPGDMIMIGEFAWLDVSVEGKPYIMTREKEIVGIIDEK